MKRTLVTALSLAALGASAGCGPTVSRAIPLNKIGTKYAKLTGYFATSGLAPGGKHEEETPGQIRHEFIRDEATFVSMKAGESCFDVVVRTESGHDEPIGELSPTCNIGGEFEALVENEAVTVADFSYEGVEQVVHAEGIAANQYLGLSIERPAEKIFRVITRTARLCCPAGGGNQVELSLDNSRWEVAEYNYKLNFKWELM